MTRWGMVVDLKRCIGCWACVVACKSENGTPQGIFWAKVLERTEGKFPDVRRSFLPIRCNHCLKPPCLEACPTGATHTRDKDNLVLIDQDKCIGCEACVIACPYDARSLYEGTKGYFGDGLTPYEEVAYKKHQVGTVLKCNFCVHRIDKGLEPACVEGCPTRALTFGDLDDPESEVSQLRRNNNSFQLRPDLGTDPSTFFLPSDRKTELRNGRDAVEVKR
ncbi:MAG: 4Fe-4S dicluster domain-containing protein [Dehalococcoidia bacterium]